MAFERILGILRPVGPWLHPFPATESEAFDLVAAFQKSSPRRVCRTIRGRKAQTTHGLFDEFAAALQFPPYFGENWDALDECLADLEWLPAEAYLLLITNSIHLLEAEPVDQLNTLFGILAQVGEEWSQPPSGTPARPPRAFQVLLQCTPAEERSLVQKLETANAAACRI